MNSCFEFEGEICDEEDNYREVTWTLKDLVEFYDYDNLYPKFEKKIKALKTLDAIACITVFTNNAHTPNREYCWTKFDFEKNEVKSGVDYAKPIDDRGINFEPSELEMFKILAEK